MNKHEWPGDMTITRLCDWVARGTSPQQVSARYTSAVRRDVVQTDRDYKALFRAKTDALSRIAKAKAK